jgi:hypothetical protein
MDTVKCSNRKQFPLENFASYFIAVLCNVGHCISIRFTSMAVPIMSQLREMFREEWWIFALVAIGVVVWGVWHGFNFFDAVNSVVVAAFWSAVIFGLLVFAVRAFQRWRNR